MSRILKAAESPPATVGLYAFNDWGSVSEQSESARREAEQILRAAREEADAIRQEAHAAGLAAASAEFEGMVQQAAGLKFEAWLPALRSALSEVAASKAAWLAQWEGAALHIATAIAGRIVRREIERTPEVTLTLIRETLELATAADAKLLLNPTDIDCLGKQLESLLAELGRASSVRIAADGGISRGGCRLETRLGSVDQRLEVQLARIEEELR